MKISVFSGESASESAKVESIVRTEDLAAIGRHICKRMWAPGTFTNNHRTLANFISMDLFVADVDGGCTIEEARQLLRDYECLIGTSRNHQREKNGKPACDRFRILIPLEQPIVTDADFKATWFEFQKLLPAIDPACKDSSRFYYPCVEVIAKWEGKRLPVTKWVAKPVVSAPVAVGARQLSPSKRTLTFAALGAPDGQWHAELVAACMDLKQQAWSAEAARELLLKATGTLDEHDEGVIEDVWANREPRHPARADSTLDAIRDTVLECLLIENVKDINERYFVNFTKGEIHTFDYKKVCEALGRKGILQYRDLNLRDSLIVYRPKAPMFEINESGLGVYNTYEPAPWRKREFWFGEAPVTLDTVPEPFNSFFTHLTNGDEASKTYLLDWMANSLRGRNFTILTAIGLQGAGKGILATILKHLHGESNFAEATDTVLKERFNGKLKNKTLVNIDEVALKNKQDHDRLKAVVNEYISIEEKGVDAETVRNYASFYITSNHLDAIQIEPGDRRFSIIELASRKLIDTELRDQIGALTSPEKIADLGRYLLARPITHDMLQPFRSARFQEVRLAGLQDWEYWLVEDFLPVHAGKTLDLAYVLEETRAENGLSRLGRPRLEALAKRFPDIFSITKESRDSSKRVVKVVPRFPTENTNVPSKLAH